MLLLLLLAAPVPGAAQSIANIAAPASDQVRLREREVEVERFAGEVRRQAALDSARREIDNDANARLQNFVGLLSALIGIFALVSTILLVIIAFRTPGQAIAAAVKAASEGLESERARINTQVAEAEQLVAEATRLVEAIRGHENTAKTIIAGLKPGESPKSEEDRVTVEAAAALATTKSPADRDANDYRAIVIDASSKEKWEDVRDNARLMAALFKADARELSFALFNEGYALKKLGKAEDALAIYDTIISRFDQETHADVMDRVAAAMYNKAVDLFELGRIGEAVQAYDNLLSKFAESPELEDWIIFSLVNKAGLLSKQGRHEDAIAVNDLIIRDNSESSDYLALGQVLKAMVNKAIALINLARYDEVLSAAEEAVAFADLHADVVESKDIAAAIAVKSSGLLTAGKFKEAIDAVERLQREFAGEGDSSVVTNIQTALYYKACAYARLAKVRGAVRALEEMIAAGRNIDCEQIASDSDFDAIRSKASFQAFLRKHGCA